MPDTSTLARKANYNIKITEIEKEYQMLVILAQD